MQSYRIKSITFWRGFAVQDGWGVKRKITINILALNISIKCDMNCERCYGHLDGFRAPYFMDFDTIRKAVEFFLSQLPATGGDIILYGGEPLLNWGLIEEFCPWFEDLETPGNVQVLLCTNGLLLTEEKIDYLARYKVRPISLSLDGDYSIYKEVRPIGEDQYNHILAMMRYALRLDPSFIVPFCVMKRKNIPRAYDILSYIASFGVRNINLYRDLMEDWTEEDREVLVERAKAVMERYNIIIQPFCESIFDCRNCYTPSVMIYPNGDIYDACYSMACVLRQKGLVTEEECRVMCMGNLSDVDELSIDLDRKKRIIRRHLDCYLVHEDIYQAIERLRIGDITDNPPFRVMEMIRREDGVG